MNVNMHDETKLHVYSLVLVLLGSVFFSYVLTWIGLPKIINFSHFVLTVILFFIVKPWHSRKKQNKLNIALVVLFINIIISSLVNNAGIINVFLEMILLSEPFILFYVIVSRRWSSKSINSFRIIVIAFLTIHVFFSFFQWLVLGYLGDDVKGVFINMGAGHHVSGAILMSFAIYYFFESGYSSQLIKALVFTVMLLLIFVTDSKQVIAAFLVSFIILSFFERDNFVKYLFLGVMAIISVYLVGEFFYPPLLAWIKSGQIFEGFSQKFSVFWVISSQFENVLQWFFGAGPGHTIGRLGWMMESYSAWLEPLGVTTSNITSLVLLENQTNWLSNSVTGSSLFSLMFSWAGIWGDLGFVGAASYLYLWYIIYSVFCLTRFSKFMVISIFIFGGVFAWLEEPAFMLFIVSLLGLDWHKNTNENIVCSQ